MMLSKNKDQVLIRSFFCASVVFGLLMIYCFSIREFVFVPNWLCYHKTYDDYFSSLQSETIQYFFAVLLMWAVAIANVFGYVGFLRIYPWMRLQGTPIVVKVFTVLLHILFVFYFFCLLFILVDSINMLYYKLPFYVDNCIHMEERRQYYELFIEEWNTLGQ